MYGNQSQITRHAKQEKNQPMKTDPENTKVMDEVANKGVKKAMINVPYVQEEGNLKDNEMKK